MMGRRIPLTEGEHTLGRSTDSSIPIDSDSVSRKHARIWCLNGTWIVDDLNSTNGVFVNDARLKNHRLQAGDIVRVGEVIFKFLHGSDIEAAYHEEIYRLTITDALTGTSNKRHFLEFLERELAAGNRHRHPISLVMMDIDHFKKINDTQGHLGGDAVLRELGSRLLPRVRREDLVARYGGEEFAFVLTHTDEAGAANFAEAIRTLVSSRPFTLPDAKSLPVTISLGVATRTTEQGDALSLIKVADDRLYKAKQTGRNRVVSA